MELKEIKNLYKYPALFSVSIAFIITWISSIVDKSDNSRIEIEKFDSQFVKSQIAIKKV